MKKKLLSLVVIALSISYSSAQSTKAAVSSKGIAIYEKVALMQSGKTVKSVQLSNAPLLKNKVASMSKSERFKKLSSMRKAALKHNNKYLANFKSRTPLLKLKASIDTTFYEGFESYDGVKQNWLPTNWTELNKTTTTYATGDSINPTWAVNQANDYTSPSTGNSMAWVDWDGVGASARNQDVWLVSPAFSPKSGDYLTFDFFYNPYWMYIDYVNSTTTTDVFNYKTPNATLQLYVSTNNGTSWTKVWDAIEDAAQFNDSTISNWSFSTGAWNTIKKSLQTYTGQSIKIAFRYVGKDGDSMGLDNISIRQLIPTALYGRPQGYFFAGLTKDYKNLASDLMFGQAYDAAQWFNYSNDDSQSFLWTFDDPKNPTSTVTSTDIHPSISYPYGEYNIPTLKASAGARDSIYKWGTSTSGSYFMAGGQLSFDWGTVGVGNYDLNQYIYDFPNGTTGDYFFGTTADKSVDAIANYFDKPAHRYLIDSLWINLAKFSAPADAEFKIIIHRVVDGYLTDTIATAICTPTDVINVGAKYYSMVFKGFTNIDPTTGLEVINDYLEISDAILVEFTGFNKSGITIAPWAQGYDSPIGENNAYVFLNSKDSAGVVSRDFYSATEYIGAYTSFLFNLGATYSFLVSDAASFVAPIAGGSKTFNINSLYSPDAWWLDAALPSWLTSELTFDSTKWAITYTLKAEPLPAGVTGRGTVVKVSTYGADMSINVNQGDYTGISAPFNRLAPLILAV